MLEQVNGSWSTWIGCWRLEFSHFAVNGICIKIGRDQESRPVGLASSVIMSVLSSST